MRVPKLFVSLVLLALCPVALAGDFVADNRIKVFLYGFPSFFSEVAVDVYNNTCLGLGNNLSVWLLTSNELC